MRNLALMTLLAAAVGAAPATVASGSVPPGAKDQHGQSSPPNINPARMFHVPSGQGDGVYHVHMDENGAEQHHRLGPLSQPPQDWAHHHFQGVAPRSLEARDEKDGLNCPSGVAVMDQTDVARASYNLGSACDSGGTQFVKERSSQYAIAGNAIVFICNHSYAPWWGITRAIECNTNDLVTEIAWIEQPAQCNMKEGWNAHQKNANDVDYSYGVTKVGSGFC